MNFGETSFLKLKIKLWLILTPSKDVKKYSTDSMFAALSNVAPPLLLDRRLFDFVGLRTSDQAEGHENAWLDHENNA